MEKKTKNNKVILPFRWAGGKYYAIKKLRQFWERVEHDEYREPFLGGGAVFWAKPKVKYNWLNDIDDGLIRTLKFIKNKKQLNSLLNLFTYEIEATKEKYELVKNMEINSELDYVYKYYYLNRTSFSGKMKNPSWGYRPKRSLPPYRWKERLIPTSEKLQNVKLTSIDFEKVILSKGKGKNVLMFLDPPYYLANQKSHYKYSFNKSDHIRLANACKKTEHMFFLTYDDCPEIRELYSWANIYDLEFFYRLDNSKNNSNQRKIGNELIITNYKINIDKKILLNATKTDISRN